MKRSISGNLSHVNNKASEDGAQLIHATNKPGPNFQHDESYTNIGPVQNAIARKLQGEKFAGMWKWGKNLGDLRGLHYQLDDPLPLKSYTVYIWVSHLVRN